MVVLHGASSGAGKKKPLLTAHWAQGSQWPSHGLPVGTRSESRARISSARDSFRSLVDFGAFPERCLHYDSAQLLKARLVSKSQLRC